MKKRAESVTLVTHDENWSTLFEAAAAELSALWGAEVLAVHHVGSTAVAGIKAKPIVDVLAIVRDVDTLDAYDGEMARRGYQPLGENGIPGRRYYQRAAGGARTHNVHVFGRGHPEIERMLRFRDRLRSHPEEARAYERLKEALAREYPDDVRKYAGAKSAFIEAVIRRAGLHSQEGWEHRIGSAVRPPGKSENVV